MEVSREPRPRRRRYSRQLQERPPSLTPARLALLRYVAELRIASLPQLAALACPSQKSARRHLRCLFDAELVDVVPVHRSTLAEPGDLNDASLLFGSAPNIYTLTRRGAKLLQRAGLLADASQVPHYGPRNSLFLAHELAVRDVRVWLELTARAYLDHSLLAWRDGGDAEIDLQRSHVPKRARPDSWFVYRLGQSVLVGLVEYDRATERGTARWKEKIAAYEVLFRGERLREVTGYVNARVLVIAPDLRRRDHLAALLHEYAPIDLAHRFWLAERSVLQIPDLLQGKWRGPEGPLERSLVPPRLAFPVSSPDTAQLGDT